jgi:hypothetical protein
MNHPQTAFTQANISRPVRLAHYNLRRSAHCRADRFGAEHQLEHTTDLAGKGFRPAEDLLRVGQRKMMS